MAETTQVATTATPLPSRDDIERASKFTREPFLSEGEDAATVLAPGAAHRRAFDAALAEIEAGADAPSVAWRRTFSLLLGLERLLADEPPKLRDGAELNPHQVDALSGTLAELMAQQQEQADDERRNGHGPDVLHEEPVEPEDLDDDQADDADAEENGADAEEDEEPQDWQEAPVDEDEEVVEEAPDDPGANRRFWFEHATGAGKTVAGWASSRPRARAAC